MSLRDLGVFAPLRVGSAEIGKPCWICEKPLSAGTRVALKAAQTSDETGSFTVEARIVCANCHLRGVEIKTPSGWRIVERVKEGDGSPYPVVTTDGQQWRDDDVSHS